MRLFLSCVLVACSGPSDDVTIRPFADATSPPDVIEAQADVGSIDADASAVYLGGPLPCGTCTCDGTQYTCVESIQGCAGWPSSADASCGTDDFMFCSPIPIECLPKPTCACLTKQLGLVCKLADDGSGFSLSCP